MSFIRRYIRDRSGVTGIEYALLAGGIAVGIVLVVLNIGSTLAGFFTAAEAGLSFNN
jgi:Flp pilus assembly pilin Flp